MMLSICITAKDSNLESLISRLTDQAKELDISSEILVAESGSDQYFSSKNEQFCTKKQIKYFKHNQHLSHGQMKNLLAQHAQGSYLLFLNGKNHITHRNYLQMYTEVMQPGVTIEGGTTASGIKPDKPYQLHWMAMHNLLTFDADQRNKHPYYHLSTNNMLIPRGIFLQHPIIEGDDYTEILPYTFDLKKNAVPVIHIDNPVSTNDYLPALKFLVVTRKQMQQTATWLKKLTGPEKEHIGIPEFIKITNLNKNRIKGLYKHLYKTHYISIMRKIGDPEYNQVKKYRNFRRLMLWEALKKG
jgi:hypothetical protein